MAEEKIIEGDVVETEPEIKYEGKMTKEITLQIKKLYISGCEIVEIQRELGIPASTWDVWYWRNTQGFREKMTLWKKERMIKEAEDTIRHLNISGDSKIRLGASKFILSHLDNENYYQRVKEDFEDKTKDNLPEDLKSEMKNLVDEPDNPEDSKDDQEIRGRDDETPNP